MIPFARIILDQSVFVVVRAENIISKSNFGKLIAADFIQKEIRSNQNQSKVIPIYCKDVFAE